MNRPAEIQVDVRRLVFPLIAGRYAAGGFQRSGLAGTGFFIGQHGLAITAAHVVADLAAGHDIQAALPTPEGPMRAHAIRWKVSIPNSDISVVRLDADQTPCFAVRFQTPLMGQNVETTAVPESMLETDAAGRTRILMRCAKGYVSHGMDGWIAASFPLPRGMSGAPVIVTEPDAQYVAGAFVGQLRGEQIEDQIEDIVDEGPGGYRIHRERIARVEYFARGDLLAMHRNFTAPEFQGLTLEQLIAHDLGPR